jgi:prepilin-type N-terminal cleavage/methylation domain-containing protein
MRNKIGFSLVELLVVIAIIAITASILLPVFMRTKIQGKVARVHVELKQIGNAVQMYCDDWNNSPPYASESCQYVDINNYYELPQPLYRYIAAKRFYDPFNPGRTYKYIAPGLGYINGSIGKITLYIPEDYPTSNKDCVPYRSQKDSPIKWVVWSVGPSGVCDLFTFHQNMMPVRKHCWYPYNENGIIVRLSDGRKSP